MGAVNLRHPAACDQVNQLVAPRQDARGTVGSMCVKAYVLAYSELRHRSLRFCRRVRRIPSMVDEHSAEMRHHVAPEDSGESGEHVLTIGPETEAPLADSAWIGHDHGDGHLGWLAGAKAIIQSVVAVFPVPA